MFPSGSSRKRRAGDYLRSCDFCARLVLRSTMKRKDGLLACSDDAKGKEARTLDRENAAAATAARRRRRPNSRRSDRDDQLDTYQGDEAILFDAILRCGPTQKSTMDGKTPSGASNPRSAAYMLRSLYEMWAENKRPHAWIASAAVKIKTLADYILGTQLTSMSKSADVLFGAFEQGVQFYTTEDAGICGLALLRAFEVTADMRYLIGARAAANFLRNMQSGFYLSGGTRLSLDPAGSSPIYTGAWEHSLSDANDGNRYDHILYPKDLVALEFLTELLAEDGDALYGCDTTLSGYFSQAPQVLLSRMIADATAFWLGPGIHEASSGLTVNGLTATTPREFFRGYPVVNGSSIFTAAGTGNWEYSNGDYTTGNAITALNWAKAIHALWAIGGVTDGVSALFTYLASVTQNPFTQSPVGQSERDMFRSLTGTFDATLAPSSVVNIRTKMNGSAFYDWASWGLLSPVQSAKSQAKLAAARAALGLKRYRVRDGNDADVPLDYLGMLGLSGLSYQTFYNTLLDGLADLELASMVMLGYRPAPTIFPMADDGRTS